MAIDRNQKKKKKREEKQKARRQQADRQSRREKVLECEWNATTAYRSQKHREALNWALKGYKLDPAYQPVRNLALWCASHLNDDDVTYSILLQEWKANRLKEKRHYVILGNLAFFRKEYELSAQILKPLVEDSPRLEGKVTKTDLKNATQCFNCSEMMLKHSPLLKAEIARSRPVSQPAGKDRGLPSRKVPAASGAAGQAEPPVHPPQPPASREEPPKLKVLFKMDPNPVLESIAAHRRADASALDLALKAYRLSFRTSYDQLICLPALHNVQSLWYQEETARKVMKSFRGRAVLADEVGLGKTIEAGLILKEYQLRGLVRSALILTPSSLVGQWQGELADKFHMPFVSTNDPVFRDDPDRFWREPFILASIQTAKAKRHFEAVVSRTYDMVIVDEAHHLKNRTTLNWKLVNALQKTFLLMLTATPVQNSLEELYNLVTLLRPGHLKTQKAFKEEFVTRGNPTDPRNREKLRQLLKEVMVRNTRSVTQLRLPPRFATTVRIAPIQSEDAFYQAVSSFVAQQAAGAASCLPKPALRKLLEAAGSSHAAALAMLEKLSLRGLDGASGQIDEMVKLGRDVQVSGKVRSLMELVNASKDKKIIFVNYVATLEYIRKTLQQQNVSHSVFQGALTAAQKEAAIDAFRDGCQVLLATGTGGEGHNLQFCHTMVNFDLPWNPMEIEQRIGRIHRIGQEKEVQIYNFCAAGTLEEHILDVLDRKINMFELVVGEVDMILGRLQGEEEFGDLVYQIWLEHRDENEREKAFDALGVRLKRARSAYEKSRELDEKLFQEDFGI
ncbi:MAG: SNF2-related protein [Pseudomonadota bacterium]